MSKPEKRVREEGARADDLAVLLQAGMQSEFEKQFKKAAAESNAAEGLASLVNDRLKAGHRRADIKVVVSRNGTAGPSVSVIGPSRLFGDSFAICRHTFCI
ncbi:MAG: hypothetical protein KC777_11025 [Cyanobacteria bacterium HKST-UBA02]|nr:hypothetical protein [Cyanobacteria bacterium HKST-UBA02]